jgi:hypothetical protein
MIGSGCGHGQRCHIIKKGFWYDPERLLFIVYCLDKTLMLTISVPHDDTDAARTPDQTRMKPGHQSLQNPMSSISWGISFHAAMPLFCPV